MRATLGFGDDEGNSHLEMGATMGATLGFGDYERNSHLEMGATNEGYLGFGDDEGNSHLEMGATMGATIGGSMGKWSIANRICGREMIRREFLLCGGFVQCSCGCVLVGVGFGRCDRNFLFARVFHGVRVICLYIARSSS